MAPRRTQPAAPAAPETDIELNLAIEDMTPEQIEAEIRHINLQTSRINLLQAQRSNTDFIHREQERVRKAAAAQAALNAEQYGRKMTTMQCVHKLGGFSNEDTYNGDDKPSIAVMDLPIEGMRMVLCIRCHKEWRSPDPRLKKTDPDTWADQAAEWKEALELIRGSRAKAMGGPTFRFETADGVPTHPAIL